MSGAVIGGHFLSHDDLERLALRSEGPDVEETRDGMRYTCTLGDLLAELLAPGLKAWSDEGAEYHHSFENLILRNIGLELKILNRAICDGMPSSEETDSLEVITADDTARAVQLIQRRAEVGAEIAHRMRLARWHNPHFGAGRPDQQPPYKGETEETKPEEIESSEAEVQS
jgi:hypothetical protein